MSLPHHINRIDSDSNHTYAWRVRIQRKGFTINKSFSDSHYGGKRKALLAAKAYRDELIRLVPATEYQIWLRNCLRKNNVSGIVGVSHHVIYKVDGSPGRQFWLASWVNENGLTRQRKFSVGILGNKRAKQMAIEARALNLQRVCALKADML
jgi:hypothetical protein